MSSLNYTTLLNQVSNLLVIPSSDPNFETMMPGAIDYAEQRLYRELDLQATWITDATVLVSSGNRNFTLPTDVGTYVVVDYINIITPAGTQSSAGTRVPLVPISQDFIDITYPSGQAATGVPEFFAMNSNTNVIFGPAPDAGYYAEIKGIQRPASLSSANSSTILTQYVPDIFVAAVMVFGSGYQRDFAAQGDNPAQGNSWEMQYQRLMTSAQTEQARAHFRSQGWTAQQPYQATTPARV